MTSDLAYCIVYTRDRGCCRVLLSEEPALDAAVSTWIDSGKTRDTLLALTAISGATYKVLASDITSWLDSTPETRARDDELEAQLKAERPGAAWGEGE